MPDAVIKPFQQRPEHGFWHFFVSQAVCIIALMGCLMVALQF